MRKKFIAVYALMAVLALGSTALTSCVDDNESASVTAIRDAKANQLNALAKVSEAEASAKALMAEADADLKKAKAEYERAQKLVGDKIRQNRQKNPVPNLKQN